MSFPWFVHGPVSIGRVRATTASVGTPVELTVPAADSLPGCTLRFAAAGLPPGLSMNSRGLTSGWPSAAGHQRAGSRQLWCVQAQRVIGWTIAGGSGRGPSGQIKLNRDGKCRARLAAADIAIEKCGHAAGQRWTIAPNGSIRVGGACLTAKSAALSARPCIGGGQRWQVRAGGALTDLGDGKCLADNGSRNGARAIAATCFAKPNNTGSSSTPGANQRWTLPAGPLTAGIAGFCASDWHRARSRSGPVTLRRGNRTSPQNWTIEPNGTVRAGGQCLSIGRVRYGTTVRLARCRPSALQQWQLASGPIGVQLVSPVGGSAWPIRVIASGPAPSWPYAAAWRAIRGSGGASADGPWAEQPRHVERGSGQGLAPAAAQAAGPARRLRPARTLRPARRLRGGRARLAGRS